MAGTANSGLVRVLVVILILALIVLFASATLRSSQTSPIKWLQNFALAIAASMIIGLSAALRGKNELERPWETPNIGQEQLDDRNPKETIWDQKEHLASRSQDDEICRKIR